MSITPARRHLIYCALLYKGLALEESHARQVAQSWHGIKSLDAFTYNFIWHTGVRSVPSTVRNLIICSMMKDVFNLEGIAGFYFEAGLWRLNLTQGSLLLPYRDANHRIKGLLVYSWLSDPRPRLLTSRGLPRGTKAEMYFPNEQTQNR